MTGHFFQELFFNKCLCMLLYIPTQKSTIRGEIVHSLTCTCLISVQIIVNMRLYISLKLFQYILGLTIYNKPKNRNDFVKISDAYTCSRIIRTYRRLRRCAFMTTFNPLTKQKIRFFQHYSFPYRKTRFRNMTFLY